MHETGHKYSQISDNLLLYCGDPSIKKHFSRPVCRETPPTSTMGRIATSGTAAFLSIGGFLFGYDSGIIASTIVQPYFTDYMGTPTAAETGGIVSSFTGGAVLGALSISYLADFYGRKTTVCRPFVPLRH